MMHGRVNSFAPHVRHINDAFPGLWPLRFRRQLQSGSYSNSIRVVL